MTDAASRSLEAAPDSPAIRAALYLRVSTNRQAENDLSIPDQKRQAERYCEAKGWQIVAEYVEPGQSATDDKRPEFQRMMDAALHGGSPFDVVLVHSFSRFFRDQFQLEFYVRKLAKADVRLVSIPDFTAHVLRHSFASLANDLGFTESTVAALVGHSTNSITSKYIHSLDSVLITAADTVAGYVQGLLDGAEFRQTALACDRASRKAALDQFIKQAAEPPDSGEIRA